MSAILSPENYGKLAEVLQEQKQQALKDGDFDSYAELSKAEAVLQTGGGIVKKPNSYLVYIAECMESKPEPGTQADTRLNFKTCALKWKELTPEEKKKYERPGLEVTNLP